MPRPSERPSRASLIASIALHVAAIGGIWGARFLQPEQITFQTLAMNVVSPPPNVEAEEYELGETESKVDIETPAPASVPEPPPANKPTPEAREAPKPAETKAPERPSAPTPVRQNENSQPSKGPNANPNSPGGINLEVVMEGLKNDYPAYYENIVLRVSECVPNQADGTRLETAVYFEIRRDGSVDAESIRRVKPSGNAEFDFEMMSVVECAARRNKFGPLPKDMRLDRLPIRYCFQPRVGGRNCAAGNLTTTMEKR